MSSFAGHLNSAGVCRLWLIGIEAVGPLLRGGDRERKLLKRVLQCFWTGHPGGLNDELLLSCFFHKYRWILLMYMYWFMEVLMS